MVHETHCVSRIKSKQYYGIIHNTVMYLKTYQDMSTLVNAKYYCRTTACCTYRDSSGEA